MRVTAAMLEAAGFRRLPCLSTGKELRPIRWVKWGVAPCTFHEAVRIYKEQQEKK